MKAYNEILLYNQWVQRMAKDWMKKNLITQENQTAINHAYADLPYQPNWFIWIGLFIFTLIGIGASTVFFLPLIDTAFAETLLGPLYGVAMYFFMNYLIKERKLHFSAIDNAFLYAILLSFIPLIIKLADTVGDIPWLVALAYLPLLLFITYRYGEPLITLGTSLNGLYIVAILAMETPWGKLLLPFIVMLFAGTVWYFVRSFMLDDRSFYWRIALNWLHVAALTVVYAAGNYYVVREGNAALNSLPDPSPEVALSGLFWLLTFLIPGLYLYAAIRWKSLQFLILGSLFLIVSLATFYHYYPFMPGEWATALLGLAGIGAAIFGMRYLKNARNGFIYEPEETSEWATLAGTIIAAEVGSSASDTPQGPHFGGGDFGGGGSGEGY
ncbi:hypothetical protein [Salmonirosea aquatica]|uniref:DUF2157 domain-containing protein n=1 Tax=Salmonirosea aquatica TaxID=2654236 RepID=A0A7C9BCQ8_9BACT|nr:hypothetical protein [Cytophagaceae bacterium SJW1-29]